MKILSAKVLCFLTPLCLATPSWASNYVNVRSNFSEGTTYFSFEYFDVSKIAFRVSENAVVVSIKDKFAGFKYSRNVLHHDMNKIGDGYPQKNKQGIEFVIPMSPNLIADRVASGKNYTIVIRAKNFDAKDHATISKITSKKNTANKVKFSQQIPLSKSHNQDRKNVNAKSKDVKDKELLSKISDITQKKSNNKNDNGFASKNDKFFEPSHKNSQGKEHPDVSDDNIQHHPSDSTLEHPPVLRSVPSSGPTEASVDAGALPVAEHLPEQDADHRFDREAWAHAQYLRGYVAFKKNDRAGAHELWNALTQDQGVGGLMATLSLTQDFLDRNLGVPESLLQRLAALAFEWRGDARETKIALTLARTHDAAGRPEAALEALARVLPRLRRDRRDPSAILAAGGEVLRGHYCGGSPKVLSGDNTLYWKHVTFAPDNAAGDAIRLCYAAALEDQDLLELAAGVLRPVVGGGRPSAKTAGRRLAALALRSGKPREALTLLRTAAAEARVPDRERDITAAEAYASLGRYDDALAQLASWTDAEASDRKADYAWRAGSWAQAAVMSREAARRAGTADRGERAGAATFRAAAAAYMAGEPAEDATARAAEGPARPGGAFITSLPSRGNLRGRALAVIEQAGRVADLADLTGIGDSRP